MTAEELRAFFQDFQDHLAPKLDTYEQAIYLYIFRHSRFTGQAEVVIGFKSARSRMAMGLGQDGRAMSEGSVYKRLDSLKAKGCIASAQSEHKGTRIQLRLPHEIDGLIPAAPTPSAEVDIEEMDFFTDAENRLAILKRDDSKCFYTRRQLDANSFVIDHVESRPAGSNSYRNLVAASREANNRKGAMAADDFMRLLFREGYLSEREFADRLKALADLKAGLLKPII